MEDSTNWVPKHRKPDRFGGFFYAIKTLSLILVTAALMSAVITLGLRGLGFKVYVISGESMSPTLSSGDVILMKKRGLRKDDLVFFTKPKGWSIVEDTSSDAILVKRVVAKGGDRVNFDGTTFSVNGKKAFSTEDFFCARTEPYQHTLAKDEMLVFGDNALGSQDSRRVFCDGSNDFLVDKSNVLASGRILLHF